MNEVQKMTLSAIMGLYQRIAELENINNVDELRLIVIRNRIADIQKIIDDFGKKLYERQEQ